MVEKEEFSSWFKENTPKEGLLDLSYIDGGKIMDFGMALVALKNGKGGVEMFDSIFEVLKGVSN